MSEAFSISDFSRTERIVFLLDLNPLLHLQDPKPYLTSLISSAETLLYFPSFSQSLFSFKLILSSLSPLLSSSKFPNYSLSLSFDRPGTTLSSLSYALNSLPSLYNPGSYLPPRASFIASSMRQLLHDYAWDSDIDEPIGMFGPNSVVQSNLVVLFSPICRTVKWASELLGVETCGELFGSVDGFCGLFGGFFENVKNAFVCKDIHCCWIDVKGGVEVDEVIDERKLQMGLFENGIRSLGWGFCSTDSIVLGSALIPFGLIYPSIGITYNFFNINRSHKKHYGQLFLEILDVNQKPLESKCCELEFVNLSLPGNKNIVLLDSRFMNVHTGGHEQKDTFFEQLSGGNLKFRVKGLQKYEECVKLNGQFSDSVLVRESSEGSGKLQKEGSGIAYADKVFEILEMELCEFSPRKCVPIWHILLCFLYREGYCALVSLSNDKDYSYIGILKPFTVSSALLNIIRSHKVVHDSTRVTPGFDPNMTSNSLNEFPHLQSQALLDGKCDAVNGSKRRKKKIDLLLHQDLTWVAFRKAAFEHSKMKLEDVYLSGGHKSSKKMKFLKCWMKQIKKSGSCTLSVSDICKPCQNSSQDIENRLNESTQEVEQPISLSTSDGIEFLSGASGIQDEVAHDIPSETSETFFSNLPNKIQQGLESEGVDLGALANRLVSSTIYWLHQKREMEMTSESTTYFAVSDNSCGSMVFVELTDLLLKEPKLLVEKHKSNERSLQAAGDSRLAGLAAEDTVRAYELQILFRMEILLHSGVAESISDSTKQKFVRQICLLLESIQCHMEGGFFGDWSLDNYVAKLIKSRYSGSLGDVVNRIYKKTDLLLFGDEAESPNPLLNSEDSNQSWRDKHDKNGMNKNTKALSSEEKFLQHDSETPQGIKQDEHARRLTEARERRERARRFSSSTSWVPDLRRVWAPKQLKLPKSKSDPLQMLKRNGSKNVSYDKVCETPMTGNKRSCPSDDRTHSCMSVSKALFQDDK